MQDENKLPTPTLLGAVAALNFACFLNCLRLFYQNAPEVLGSSCDTGWIVKTGEYILQNHAIPRHDIFTWTNPDQPFVAYQWLFEVFCAILFKTGGLWLVGASCYTAAGVLYLYLLPLIWQRLKLPLFLAYAALSLVLSPWWFNARPQLISYFLILFFIAVLEADRNKPTKLLFTLPLAMILWANTHSFWSMGLVIIAAYAIVATITKRAGYQRLLSTCALTFLSVLANPYGWNLIRHIISFADNEQWMGVWEVLPSYLSPDFKYFFAYLGLMWMVMIRSRKTVPAEHFLLCAFASAAAIFVRRYESVAVFITWPLFGLALSRTAQLQPFLDRVSAWSGGVAQEFLSGKWFTTPKRKLASLLCIVAIGSGFWFHQFPDEHRARAVFCNYGDESISFFSRNFKGSRTFFSDPATGAWLLIFDISPVFIDTRYDMYPKTFCQNAIYCVAGVDGWDKFLADNRVDTIVMRNITGLTRRSRTSPDWYVLLDDGVVSVYVKRKDAAALTKRLHVTNADLKISTFKPTTIARTLFARNQTRIQSSETLTRTQDKALQITN